MTLCSDPPEGWCSRPAPLSHAVTCFLFSLQELLSGDPTEGPFREDQCPLEGKSYSSDLTDSTLHPSHMPKTCPQDTWTDDPLMTWTTHAPCS